MRMKSLREFFLQTKSKLVLSCEDKTDYNLDQLEYLIRLVDYFLTGKVELNTSNFTIFLDEIITTAIMQLDMELLDLVKPFSYLTGEEHEISL